MPRPNKLLLVLSFVGFIALGLPDAVIGVVWPALRAHFGLHQDALGPLFITVTVGSVMASTASGAILSRLGIGELLAFSCALTAVALFGYTIAPSWIVLVSLGLLTGFGAGAIDAAINTHAATRYSARLVNVLHAFYGVGAAAGPALMTTVLTTVAAWLSNHCRRRNRAGSCIRSVSPAVATAGRHPRGTSTAGSAGGNIAARQSAAVLAGVPDLHGLRSGCRRVGVLIVV
jgi:fucose permease